MNGYINSLIVLPEDMHREFKTKLASEGRTQKEFFISIIRAYIDKGKDEKKEKDRSQKTS